MGNLEEYFKDICFAMSLRTFMVLARETNKEFQRLAHCYFIPYLEGEMKINLSPVPVDKT